MINGMKIMDEINRLLVKKYPNHTVYLDLCPKNFDRPSFLIELVTINRRPINSRTIEETVYFTITCFDEVDKYSHSNTVNLLTVQQGVLDIFRQGYIKVDDRNVEVKASSGGRNFDEAYVDVQVEYFEDRSDIAETLPLMKEVITTIKEE